MRRLLIACLLVLVVVFLFRENILSYYATLFQKELLKEKVIFDSNGDLITPKFKQKYDAIFILGGNANLRLIGAITLYQHQIANEILFTQTKDYKNRFSSILQDETTKNKIVLQQLKIPFVVIPTLTKEGTTSTLEEAQDLAEFLKTKKYQDILLITDLFHTQRTYSLFTQVFQNQNLKTRLYILGLPNIYYNQNNWWKTELGLRTYIVETGIWIIQAFGGFKDIQKH